jgi:murein DD-endopeptidase MepM/ murein hydrolase activator NlpD
MKVAIYLLLIMTACASKPVANQTVSEFSKENIQPGIVKFIKFNIPEEMKGAELRCRNDLYSYDVGVDGMGFSYIADSYFSDLSDFVCVLKNKNEEREVFRSKMVTYPFKVEKLKVDYKTVKLSKKDADRVAVEQQILNKVYSKSSKSTYFFKPFEAPLKSYITSYYGIKRIYNNHHNGQHLGTDFRSAIGTKIPASNRGKVVMAQNLFYTGYTVVIDHGLSIFSIYAHLSELKVKEGDIVNQGDIIGLSGNTGRSSGPHLHWGLKVQGHHVDGFSVVESSKVQFN